MIIEADVKCYHCGHVSGHVVGDANQPLHPKTLQPIAGPSSRSSRPGDRIRCLRCGGPVYLDDIVVRREKRRASGAGRQMRLVAQTT